MPPNAPYPEFTNSMPPVTTGPLALIDPPLAFTPLTVVKSRKVSKSQITEWWRELREMHESNGMQARRARDVAYRQARVAELLVQDCTQPEIAERVGCSE